MDKKQFIVLLYAFGVVPMMYSFSNTLLPSWGGMGFGLFNVVVLILFALVFTSNQNPITKRKKKIAMIVLGSLLLLGVLIGGLSQATQKASIRLHTTVFAPATPPVVVEQSVSTTGATGDAVAISLFTGEVDIDALVSGQKTEPDYPAPTITTGASAKDPFQAPDPKPVSTEAPVVSSTVTTVLPSKGTLNYAQVIPYLVSTYNLKNNGKSTTFTNITSTSALYSAFNIAANKGMIGVGINPASKMSCNTYLVMKGIAAGWKVEYKSGDPFGPYRAVADQKGETNGCAAGSFVTKATL